MSRVKLKAAVEGSFGCGLLSAGGCGRASEPSCRQGASIAAVAKRSGNGIERDGRDAILNCKAGISRNFRYYRQEDAHELMVSLLESMHKCCLPSGIASESPSPYEKSLVHRIFGGRLKSQVRCTRCSHCSNTFDPFLDLSVEIGNAATLMKALYNFTEEELLDGGEKHYNCQQSKEKVVAKKRFLIDKAPFVLAIHLKRFSPFNPLQKIDKKVDFRTTLNLKPSVSNSEGMDLKYNLYGVLVHAGRNTQSVEKTLDFSLITKVDTKLQMQNPDKGQPSHISAVSQDQCSNEHSNIEDVKASTSQNNAPVQKVPCTLPDGADALSTKEEQVTQCVQREIISPGQPEVCIPDMKTQKLNPDNDQPSNINTTISQDQCSNEHGSTEVTKDLTSQNNELVQKARCTDPDGTATLYSKPEQITPANQMERTSIGQPDACILCDASSDQKAYEKPLQDVPLESDGALVNSGKDILNSALRLCSGVDGLLGANEQANEPRTYAFCKPTPDSDATTIAQAIPTEVTDVSNGTMSGNKDSTSNDEAKGLVVKELSVKNIDDKVKAEEQTTMGNNTLGDGLAMVNEVSVMEMDHTTDAVGQNNSLDTGHVNLEKKICSEDATHVASSEDCVQVMCSENSVHVVGKNPCHGSLHKNMKIKSKKHVKHPVVNLCFGSKQLLLASLKPRKKRKHKSSAVTEGIADDQQTSTSETVLTSGISHKSHRRKHCRNSASSEDSVQIYGKKQNLGHSCAVELTVDKKGSEDATLAGAELASLCPRSMSNPDSGKCGGRDEKGSWHFNLLTRGLRVLRWDDDDMATELQCSNSTSIGYVLDKWDEEYDSGKRKKVRKSMRGFSGPNPFQEVENIRSRQQRRLQADQARSGHQPLRI
ncbi:unnamed protein product [Miscanthus lutarioriparius]|uniref:USP domain-containing protein n=1 Tax=Miscanthus lutarioriparius TaxID=422564 RepID=A0A811PZ87_9POAL|nr:unnamed protein product [Miscanthus lutarioriparius]